MPWLLVIVKSERALIASVLAWTASYTGASLPLRTT